jgi:hypothetical protein
MGTYLFTVIEASWRTPRYEFEDMKDVQGPELREKYWKKSMEETFFINVYTNSHTICITKFPSTFVQMKSLIDCANEIFD